MEMRALGLAAVFVTGAAVGSFLNVVIYRIPRGLSIVRPGSRCPACGSAVGPRDNVPILSYVLLRGRCRMCGVRIGSRYPIVEGATGALWTAAALRFGIGEVGS